jgi:DNA gyrase subunit A
MLERNMLMFFTDKGRAYQIKMYEIAEGKKTTKGKSIMNYLQLEPEENVTSVLAMPKDVKKGDFSIMMTTRLGVAKRVDAQNFHDVRRSGIISIKLHDGDKLVSASFVGEKDETIVVTQDGQSIRFKADDIRAMGRSAAGVRAIKLSKDDKVVSGMTVKSNEKDKELLVFSENGYGKQTSLDEYKVQNRGGSGIKTAKVTEKNGVIIAGAVVNDEVSEIVAMSKKGQVIRVKIDEIPELGRQTQGVRIMKLRAGDTIASLVCL